MVACAAWNATILHVEKRESMLADMRKTMPDQQSREDFTAIVKELMKRKNQALSQSKPNDRPIQSD